VEWAQIFSEARVVGFILLFIRFGAMFMATPIFSHQSIPVTIKTAMAFFFTVLFYPSMPPLAIEISAPALTVAVLGELLFGLVVGVALQLAYHVITFAGGQISFTMGFSLASAIDPQSGVSMPIISQFLSLLALMLLFSIDMHHWILLYVNESLSAVPLGGFMLTEHLFGYLVQAAADMFRVGFMIAFPIIAITILEDIIFGMLMKTMPQFNLLVIGFPIKIAVALVVLIVTLGSTLLIVRHQVEGAFNWLEALF